MKPKILIVLGPTSSGKSGLAVKLAKKFNGEVISADSRQVYKGLDIGTGKVTKKEMSGIPHHLLDVVSPNTVFTVLGFQKKAYKAINDVISRGKLPIIAGGTGFYIQSIVEGITLPEVKENKALRKQLEKLDIRVLQKKLKKLDPVRYKEIDINNKVRLVRAIEVASSLGKVPKVKSNPRYTPLQIGLLVDRKKLTDEIYKRLLWMIKVGMIKEVEDLHNKKKVSWKRFENLGLEYRYAARYLQNKISKDKMIEELRNKINQYAKRQMTWFKRDKNIKWFSSKERKKIEFEVKKFIN